MMLNVEEESLVLNHTTCKSYQIDNKKLCDFQTLS
uniref:Uncharacterized protein n=1 Tax=Rhizophora mucronata TaxID=61149 RepID=A0A2P2QNN9_RHIMU